MFVEQQFQDPILTDGRETRVREALQALNSPISQRRGQERIAGCGSAIRIGRQAGQVARIVPMETPAMAKQGPQSNRASPVASLILESELT